MSFFYFKEYPKIEKIKLKNGYKIIKQVDYANNERFEGFYQANKKSGDFCFVFTYDKEGKLISKELKKNPHQNIGLPHSEGAV